MSARPQRHQNFLQGINPVVRVYRPSPETAAVGNGLNVRAVVGPARIGKNTLMAASGLDVATVSTSREPRTSDTTYRRYFDFAVESDRNEVLDALLRTRNYIQAAIHPASGELYCTEAADFPGDKVNLLDVTSKEYVRLRKSGIFGTITAACIVTPTYEQLQEQWIKAEGELPADYPQRTEEGYQSLITCLADPEMDFVINTTPEDGGLRLAELALGRVQSEADKARGRAAAETILHGMIASGVLGPKL